MARADTCSECPEPAFESLTAAAGVSPSAVVGGLVSLATDAGECRYTVTPPLRKLDGVVVVWDAEGMAFNCPFGTADSELKIEIGDTASYSWTVSASGGLKLSAGAAAEVSGSFGRTDELSHARSVTASVTNPIRAASGHKLHWHAYYFAGRWSATAEVVVERRWAWWTKASTFSSEVLARGDIWMACGNGAVAGRRLEALAVCIALEDFACANVAGVDGTFIGWFPPPPPGLTPPFPFPPHDPPPDKPGDPHDAPPGTPPPGDEPPDDGGPASPGAPSGQDAPPHEPPVEPPSEPPPPVAPPHDPVPGGSLRGSAGAGRAQAP